MSFRICNSTSLELRIEHRYGKMGLISLSMEEEERDPNFVFGFISWRFWRKLFLFILKLLFNIEVLFVDRKVVFISNGHPCCFIKPHESDIRSTSTQKQLISGVSTA